MRLYELAKELKTSDRDLLRQAEDLGVEARTLLSSHDDEDEAKLEGALQNQVGASYTIVAYVGEQVVAGLNRCLLVQVTPVVPDARPHYALAYVYTDLQGESTLTEVIDLDVGSLCTYGA